MFIEPTITWVPLGFSGYIWLDTKIVLKTTTVGMGRTRRYCNAGCDQYIKDGDFQHSSAII